MKVKKIIIATLLTIGLVAMCGEPAEDIVATMATQLLIFATTWGLAAWLANKWGIINH